jgi:hypothetical protein
MQQTYAARKFNRHQGEIDEAALFAAIEEMRATEREAARLTRSARRDRTRRTAAPGQPAAPPPSAISTSAEATSAAAAALDATDAVAPAPFDIIEQW